MGGKTLDQSISSLPALAEITRNTANAKPVETEVDLKNVNGFEDFIQKLFCLKLSRLPKATMESSNFIALFLFSFSCSYEYE
jgi:hypothetical protein